MKFTVAQGDQTLTIVVPMAAMVRLAEQAGPDALADTGGSATAPAAIAVVAAATGLMLIPALRRRRHQA